MVLQLSNKQKREQKRGVNRNSRIPPPPDLAKTLSCKIVAQSDKDQAGKLNSMDNFPRFRLLIDSIFRL